MGCVVPYCPQRMGDNLACDLRVDLVPHPLTNNLVA
jgi:hypothetical protein